MKDSCQITPVHKSITEEEKMNTQVTYLAISGLNCPNCALRVKNALMNEYGVIEALIDHADGMGEITFNPEIINRSDLVNIISKAGNDGTHSYSAIIIE